MTPESEFDQYAREAGREDERPLGEQIESKLKSIVPSTETALEDSLIYLLRLALEDVPERKMGRILDELQNL